MMKTSHVIVAAAAAAVATCAAPADLIDFETFGHGEIVNGIATDSNAVAISALNPNRSHDLAIVFDSMREDTADPDLEFPWATGNLAADTVLGKLLIIAENDVDGNGDGFIDRPDDEGSRPAGSLTFDFEIGIAAFGFDIIDVEGLVAENGSIEFLQGDTSLGEVTFADLVDFDSDLYDPTIAFGNRSANRVAPVSASYLGVDSFDRVRINMGGSGAIDNLMFQTIPSPGAAALLLAAFGVGRRRRRMG